MNEASHWDAKAFGLGACIAQGPWCMILFVQMRWLTKRFLMPLCLALPSWILTSTKEAERKGQRPPWAEGSWRQQLQYEAVERELSYALHRF